MICGDADGLLSWLQTDEQQSLVLQLQQVTSLNYQFAHMCLAQNGWDPHQALSQFQTLHAQGAIPPEAFAHQQQVVQPAA
jgi:nuclear RNA export factor